MFMIACTETQHRLAVETDRHMSFGAAMQTPTQFHHMLMQVRTGNILAVVLNFKHTNPVI